MKSPSTPPDDTFQIRCPKLGHLIHFSYCRHENFGTPCTRTLDCWYAYFPVAGFLKKELTEEEWKNSFGKPVVPKVLSLVELIELAQQKAKRGGEPEG